MKDVIEVIDQYNARHRFSASNHFFEWRLKEGTFDVEGSDFLDIYQTWGDESELVVTFLRPACVGLVGSSTVMGLPLREKATMIEDCPRCGSGGIAVRKHELPDDEEVARVFGGADFGPASKTPDGRMRLVCEGLLKVSAGFSCGSTLRGILMGLKMVGRNSVPTSYGRSCILAACRRLSQIKGDEIEHLNT